MAKVLEKRSYERRLFALDLSPTLRDSGDTIASVESVAALLQGAGTAVAVAISDVSFTDMKVQFIASAGQGDRDYTIRTRVLTAGDPEQRLEAVVRLAVRDPTP